MKTLGAYLESLLDDDDVYLSKVDKLVVKNWIITNYKITGNLTISDDLVVDCSGGVTVYNKSIESLTNGMFRWGKVMGNFSCSHCNRLTSLKDSPEEISGGFRCIHCDNLTSLEGAPKSIGKDFECSKCANLKNLKGAPEKVRSFYCEKCYNLTSLEGAPKIIEGEFVCYYCKNLKITDSDREKILSGLNI